LFVGLISINGLKSKWESARLFLHYRRGPPNTLKEENVQRKSPYQKFNDLVRELVKVPHSEIKAKLDAEKEAKKRKKARQSSASHEVSGRV